MFFHRLPFLMCGCALTLGASVGSSSAQQSPDAGATTLEVTPPRPVQPVDAVYPADALTARREATVVLLVTVDADGRVSAVSVSESGGESFDRAAQDAIEQWRFTPALRGDAAVPSRIRVPFYFKIPAAEPAEQVPASAASTQPPMATAPSAGAASAPATEPEPPQSASETALDVTVRGTIRLQSRGTSDLQIAIGELALVPRQNASDMLKLAPGILLTNEAGQAHADQVFLRGFDAREGQDIEFTTGGVPINEAGNLHGNGYADTHFLIPELVTSLRVIEGPYDPRQGNFAVAGSADYELGLAQPGITAQQTLGSFSSARTLLLWRPEQASQGTFVGADLNRTAGYGQNRDGQSGSLLLQYEGDAGANSFRIGASAYSASFHSAGVLREDDFEHKRVGFYDTSDPNQGQDSSRYSLWAELETKSDRLTVRNQLFGIVRPMRLRENFTGFLLDTQQPIQQPHAQRGDLIELINQGDTVGARGSARMEQRVFDQRQAVEVGYFARVDFVRSSQRRIEAATGHPYHLDTDLDSTLGDIGLYADLDVRATSWLALRGGVRADLFTFDVLNQCAVQSVSHPSRVDPPGDTSCLSQQDFGAYREPTQSASTIGGAAVPRASLIVGPFGGVGAALAYGRGVRSIDPIYISQDARTPFASAESIEAGVRLERTLGNVAVSARSTVFQTRVDKDLIFSETAGRNLLGGTTTRTGDATALRMTGTFFDVAANATWVRAVFHDSGLLIPYIPDFVFRFDGSLFDRSLFRLGEHFVRATFATGVTYVSPRPLPQAERSNMIFTTDVQASLGWSMFELSLRCMNLFDAQYRLGEYNYVSDFRNPPSFPGLVPVRHFTAGPPRALYISLALYLGGQS